MARPGLTKHPKFRRLAAMIGSKALALGSLEFLWSVAYESGDAVIGDAVDVELSAEWEGEPGRLAEALIACRFLDTLTDGALGVHDLMDHAPDYVRQRRVCELERRKPKNCAVCGSEYRATKSSAKYCSAACKQESYRSRVTERYDTVTDSAVTVTERYPTPAPAPAPAPIPKESTANAVPVEAEPSTPTETEPKPIRRTPTPSLDWVAELWNETAAATGLAQVTKLTDPRKRAAAARLREFGEDALRQVLTAPLECPLLRGEVGDRGWKASLDWVLGPKNFPKVLEGNYRTKRTETENERLIREVFDAPTDWRVEEASRYSSDPLWPQYRAEVGDQPVLFEDWCRSQQGLETNKETP